MRFMQVSPVQIPSEKDRKLYRFDTHLLGAKQADPDHAALMRVAGAAATLEALRTAAQDAVKAPAASEADLRRSYPRLSAAADDWAAGAGAGLAPHVKGALDHWPEMEAAFPALFALYAYDTVFAQAPRRRALAGLFLRIIAAAHQLNAGTLKPAPDGWPVSGREHSAYEFGVQDFITLAVPDIGFALAAKADARGGDPYPDSAGMAAERTAQRADGAEIAQLAGAAAELRALGPAGQDAEGAAAVKRLSDAAQAALAPVLGGADAGVTPAQLSAAIGQRMAALTRDRAVLQAVVPMMVVEGLVVDLRTEMGLDDPCRPVSEACLCDLLSVLDDKHKGKSAVRVMGVGDIYRLDCRHDRYVTGGLLHTEPVLGKSEKTVSFSQLEEEESIFTSETETAETQTSESVAEERFKLETMAEHVAEQERSSELGVNASAQYGPVKVDAAYGQSSATAQTDRVETARETARETTSRAVREIRKQTKTTTSTRRLTRSERVSGFGIDNRDGGSFTGYYHAIDQVMVNQLKLVGRRMLVRAMFERPMAFVKHCLASGGLSAKRLDKPVPPDQVMTEVLGDMAVPQRALRMPSDITPENVEALAAVFDVTGLEQPPAATTVSLARHGVANSEDDWPRDSGMIDIPAGYAARWANIHVMLSSGDGAYIDIALGQKRSHFTAGATASFALGGEETQLPWAYRGKSGNAFTFGITVQCEPNSTTLNAWRARVFDAIWQAYHSRQAAYDAALAAAASASVANIRGRNPAQNAILVREELIKLFLGAVYPAGYYRGLMRALKYGADCRAEGARAAAVPVQDFLQADADAPMVSFLMRAFEFEAMTWRFHPYFTAQRGAWAALLNGSNPDPAFEAALRAGAVEVDLPVRPGFEQAVLYFLEHHEPWEGGDIPPLSSPLSQGIAVELAQIAQQDEIDAGAPWEETLPTALLKVTDTPPHDL